MYFDSGSTHFTGMVWQHEEEASKFGRGAHFSFLIWLQICLAKEYRRITQGNIQFITLVVLNFLYRKSINGDSGFL